MKKDLNRKFVIHYKICLKSREPGTVFKPWRTADGVPVLQKGVCEEGMEEMKSR